MTMTEVLRSSRLEMKVYMEILFEQLGILKGEGPFLVAYPAWAGFWRPPASFPCPPAEGAAGPQGLVAWPPLPRPASGALSPRALLRAPAALLGKRSPGRLSRGGDGGSPGRAGGSLVPLMTVFSPSERQC